MNLVRQGFWQLSSDRDAYIQADALEIIYRTISPVIKNVKNRENTQKHTTKYKNNAQLTLLAKQNTNKTFNSTLTKTDQSST